MHSQHQPVLSRAALVATAAPTAGDDSPSGIMFGSGVPDPALYPSEALARELSRALNSTSVDLGYSRAAGQPSLRRAVAERLRLRTGEEFGLDDVAITAGASGALQLATAALLDPGDVIITEEFTYPAAVKMFRQLGARVITVPTDDEGPDTAALEEVLGAAEREGQRVKAVYTVAPYHSPTTAVLTAQRAARLVEVAERYDTVLLVDDTYGEIHFGAHSALAGVLFRSGRALHLGSFSKTIAPALRLGWAAGNRELVDAIKTMRTDIGVSLVLQEAVAALMDSGEYAAHLERVRSRYRDKRDVLLEALAGTCAGRAAWRTPEGSFFLWVNTEVDVGALDGHARAAGVGFIPGSTFAVNGVAPHSFRLAYGYLSSDDLRKGAVRLGYALANTKALAPPGRSAS